MLPTSLLDHTCAKFPDFAPEDIAVTPLEKGGSDRKFYRIDTGGGRSLILVKYGDQREENRHYVEVAHFLADRGINIPQIYHHDASEGLIWMQDLGEIDLWAHRNEPWETRKVYYQKTLDQAARLHALDPQTSLQLQPIFDSHLYQWEQNYFFENCLGLHFGIEFEASSIPMLETIRERLSEQPRVLIHRDFQSQNIMVRDEDAWLIDFQGMRPGLLQYDLASLLYDPYVDLTKSERSEMLTYYQSVADIADPNFTRTFHDCALQRLMQALGAYGFLGHHKGKPEFLRHIPKALASLREVIGEMQGMEKLSNILEAL
ncbi:MAG: phosphotransferase [Chthoniobacterales bacterium]